MNSSKGFTLIELMVVVSIIGTLAAIAIPNYMPYLIRAQIAEGLMLAEDIKSTVQTFYKERGSFPIDNQMAGVPAPNKLLGNYVKGMTVANGAIHIQYGHDVHTSVANKTLTLRPQVVIDSPLSPMSWSCGHHQPPPGMRAIGDDRTDLPNELLPHACRRR
ncbi:pilin [Thiospirillum jenense]|uniref:Pilin n=1 Tax=Thiospirillum jenense TaxID=1653858 RepID=A0A839HH47_9GAMM|nr:pilin [Thiospirillum jenense]MBB1126357.1 pilin [Thiospirillum jenense]